MKAGDKAVLSCETDSLPEPAVTWYKDRRPLAPAQRARTLQGGQRLEILDTQVSNPVAWAAMQCHLLVLVGGGGVLPPPRPARPQAEEVKGSLGGWTVGRARGSALTHRTPLGGPLPLHLPQCPGI